MLCSFRFAIYACLVLFVLMAVPVYAAAITDLLARVQPDPQGVLVNGLPYRLFVPKDYNPGNTYPLVLCLHGAGERGIDNTRQGGNGLLLWTQPKVQEKYPCFVLLPQCPQAIDTFQLVKATNHPCGLHEFAVVDPKDTASKRISLPLGRFLRGEKKTLVFLTESVQKEVPVDFTLANIRISANGKDEGAYCTFTGRTFTALSESFHITSEGCYVATTPQVALAAAAMKSRVSEDGLALQITSAPNTNMRVGIDCPCTITPETVLYADIQVRSAGYGQRLGFLQGDRIPEYRWVNMDWGKKMPDLQPAQASASMRLVLDALDAVRKSYAVDPTRIYVTGLSMGGYGTWDIIARRPALFAAAVPVCGGGDPATAPAMAGIPIWAFHGGNDGVVPTDRTRLMIEALTRAGGHPKYTEYPGVGHDSWNKAYTEPELVDWLFAQRRKLP